MNSSVNDRVKGALHRAKGKAKEIVGQSTDNRALERNGRAEKREDKVQETVGQIKRALEGPDAVASPGAERATAISPFTTLTITRLCLGGGPASASRVAAWHADSVGMRGQPTKVG
jgi:uncharacterized protein YjbJ (UPF0337 family)